MGVTITRAAMMTHCRTLTMACNYTEGENMVCVLDFKREVGLWHSVLTSILNGMHIIFIPYALMKVNPASWMQMITKYRGLYLTDFFYAVLLHTKSLSSLVFFHFMFL